MAGGKTMKKFWFMQYASCLLLISTVFGVLAWSSAGFAGGADVVDVKVMKRSSGVYDFTVTLKHADSGWKHYANRWDVLGPDMKVLATRVLHHPHVEEQPFTRSLSGVRIPETISRVTVRGNDSVHGMSGAVMVVELPK